MDYNEEYYAKSSNRKAMAMWAVIGIVLTVAYVIELFGWFGVEKQPWELRKAIGMIIAIVVIIIFKWK